MMLLESMNIPLIDLTSVPLSKLESHKQYLHMQIPLTAAM